MRRHEADIRAARSPRRRAKPGGSRAFTLVEILVALSAGVLVSLAAFSLSKNATYFFQHEARIATAQLSVTLGINRITADLQRASFLSSPAARKDPSVCGQGLWGAAPGLTSLAGVTILPGATAGTSQNGQNGLNPDTLIIGGSLDSSEVFTVQCVVSGAGSAPALQLQSPAFDNAMARVVQSLGTGETLAGRLNATFAPGRFVQLFDPATGTRYFGVIGAGTPVAVVGNVATVQLASTPSLPTKPTSPCGMIAPPSCGAGLLVSVVSRVRYDIRSLVGVAGSVYAPLVTAPPGTAAITGDAGRTELVRVELDAAGAEVASTMELVAEYAVDMRFGITVASQIQNDNYAPTHSTFAIGDPNIYPFVDDLGTVPAANPQRVRAVQVRFAARARAPDRNADLPTGNDGRRLHFLVNNALQPSYARVRTGYTNVALANQGGFSLW